MDAYPAVAAVGEVGDAQYGLQIVSDYTSGGDKVHMCYAFDFLSNPLPSVDRVADVLTRFQKSAADGWPCWAFSNHDVVRHASRWAAADQAHQDRYLVLLTGLLLAMRGSVCLYQGEELGLTEADVPFEALQDPYGIEFWPEFKGRDGCRTPMVWASEPANAGFTAGDPWLPIPAEHHLKAVDRQEQQVGSMLNRYRELLRFRREHLALAKGSLEVELATGPVLSFTRSYQNQTLYCAFNLSADEQFIIAPDDLGEVLDGHGFSGQRRGETIEIPPYDAFFARLG